MTFEELVRVITQKLSIVNGITTNPATANRLAQVLMPFLEENIDYIDPILNKLLAIKEIENYSDTKTLEAAKKVYEGILGSLYNLNCELRKTLPPTQALYIIGFDEIFTEIKDENERRSILVHLEKKIERAILDSQPIFINYSQEADLKELLAYTEHHFLISELLVSQTSKESFFAECLEKGVVSLCVGGVFGSACVWGFATELAENIFSRLIPSDSLTHVNIRFNPGNYQFKNVVIDHTITEGHTDREKLFEKYLAFTQTVLMKIPAETFVNDVPYDPESMQDQLRKKLKEYLSNQGLPKRKSSSAFHVADSPIHTAKKSRNPSEKPAIPISISSSAESVYLIPKNSSEESVSSISRSSSDETVSPAYDSPTSAPG